MRKDVFRAAAGGPVENGVAQLLVVAEKPGEPPKPWAKFAFARSKSDLQRQIRELLELRDAAESDKVRLAGERRQLVDEKRALEIRISQLERAQNEWNNERSALHSELNRCRLGLLKALGV